MLQSRERPFKDFNECDEAERTREERSRPLRRNVRIFLIRHGESETNLFHGRIGGQTIEVRLSQAGRQQAMMLRKRLKVMDIQFEKVYSSTAVRAFETAQIALPGVEIEQREELLEQGQGDWEAQERDKVMTEEALAQMNSDPWNFKAPQTGSTISESPREVEERMYRFVTQRILTSGSSNDSHDHSDENEFSEYEAKDEQKQSTEAQKGETSPPSQAVYQNTASMPCVAVFAHGGSIRYLMRRILASDPHRSHRNMMGNTCITEIVYSTAPGGQGGWFLRRYNDTAHLEYES